MIFKPTGIAGAYLLIPEVREDDRGFFARTWCTEEFEERGLDASFTQCSVSFNRMAGTLRGMHFQAPPHDETKLVRCTAGAIYDVVLDLRRDSKSFRRWIAFELTSENHYALYVPPGCAHGFQTLADCTEVLYHITHPYTPEFARGVRWNDTAFAIAWPEHPSRTLSPRDAEYPDFSW